jgi:hypothetical protein
MATTRFIKTSTIQIDHKIQRMRIIHKIGAFLNAIFPNINSDGNIITILEDIKQTVLEIAMLSTLGIDQNKKEYIISSITDKRFS